MRVFLFECALYKVFNNGVYDIYNNHLYQASYSPCGEYLHLESTTDHSTGDSCFITGDCEELIEQLAKSLLMTDQ